MKQINRDILKLAVPSILANITVPLVGMADIASAMIRAMRFMCVENYLTKITWQK